MKCCFFFFSILFRQRKNSVYSPQLDTLRLEVGYKICILFGSTSSEEVIACWVKFELQRIQWEEAKDFFSTHSKKCLYFQVRKDTLFYSF